MVDTVIKEKSLNMKPFYMIFCLLIGVCSCQDQSNKSESTDAISDTVSVTVLTGDAVKLVKTAGIQFKVEDVVQGVKAVSQLTKQAGGMVVNQELQSIEESQKELEVSSDSLMIITAYTPQASVTVRVPTAQLESFLFSVADLGYYTSSSRLHIDDKSLAYLQNALQQKARAEVLSQKRTGKPLTDIQAIAVKDEAIQQQIANQAIDSEVAYSTVELSLFQNALVNKEMIANYKLSGYQQPFSKRLQSAISNGWQAFTLFILALSHLWVFLLLALISFVLYKQVQHRKKIPATNLSH
jgi:hypothetical protein